VTKPATCGLIEGRGKNLHIRVKRWPRFSQRPAQALQQVMQHLALSHARSQETPSA
jgi:hypothetical protein